jgi:hypothetical protein
LVLALAGCGGTKQDEQVPTATTITRSLAAPHRKPTFGFDVPISTDGKQFSPAYTRLGIPGVYRIVFSNDGKIPHALVIEGQGGRVELGPVAPGGTVSKNVDLTEAGDYKIYCPIDDHRHKGEEGLITRGA